MYYCINVFHLEVSSLVPIYCMQLKKNRPKIFIEYNNN